jgi:hypothetical protein
MRITGSTLPLLAQCQYWARPEVDAPPIPANDAMLLGTEIHNAIDHLLSGRPLPGDLSDDARVSVDVWSDWWASSDLKRAGGSGWKSEIAYAYNPKTDTARCLGNVGGRNYGKLGDDEIAGSIDALYVAGDKAAIVDWKTGWDIAGMTADAKDNKQLRGYALAVSRHHKVESVDVYIVRITEDGVKTSTYSLDAFDLADAANDLKNLSDAVPSSLPKAGTHCRRCRAVSVCPATAKSTDELAPRETAIDAPPPIKLVITSDNAALLYARLVAVRAACDSIDAALKSFAEANDGIRLDNGKVYKKTETNRSSIKLDGPEGAEALAALARNGLDEAVESTPRTSQAAIKRAIQATGLKGKEASAKLDAVMGDLNAAGAIRTATITSYREQ